MNYHLVSQDQGLGHTWSAKPGLLGTQSGPGQ